MATIAVNGNLEHSKKLLSLAGGSLVRAYACFSRNVVEDKLRELKERVPVRKHTNSITAFFNTAERLIISIHY